ncbi:MAG TPA: translocation/assembly module TamB domain-containing protein [Vicinamibacterales bacterium]|nr:translocation/assembly module TamB domain-containing protein [Vicinamibacterales bacterium]
MRSDSRWPRRLAWIAGAVVLLALAAWGVLESAWTEERVRRLIVDRAGEALAADLTIERLSGSVFGDVTLSGVSLTLDGRAVLTARTVTIRFRPVVVARQGLVFEQVTMVDPRFSMVEDERGWNVARLTRERAQPAASDGPRFAIDRLEIVGGTIDVVPLSGVARQVKEVSLASRIAANDGTLHVEVLRMAGVDVTSGTPVTSLTGTLRVTSDEITGERVRIETGSSRLAVDVTVPRHAGQPSRFSASAENIPAHVVQAWTPALSMVPPSSAISVTASGSFDVFDAEWTVASPDGVVAGRTEVTVASDEWRFQGRARATNWMPGAFFAELDGLSRLSGQGEYDVRVPDGVFDRAVVAFEVSTPDVTYEGYRATAVRAAGTYRDRAIEARASGVAYRASVTTTARWDQPTSTLTATGTFDGVDLEQLPARLELPRLPSSLVGRYAVTGSRDTWDLSADFDRSEIAGAVVHAASTGRLVLSSGVPRYTARVDVDGVDPARLAAVLPDQSGLLQRLAGSVNASVDLDASGTSRDTLTGTADVRLKASRVAGVTIDDLHATGSLVDHRLDVSVTGRIDGALGNLAAWDPAIASVPVSGAAALTGRFEVPDVTAQWSLGDVRASGRVSLTGITAWDTRLTRVEADAVLNGGRLTVSSLEIAGDDVSGRADGIVVLAGAGQSNLSFALAAADLSSWAGLVGVEAAGSAEVTGRVTGDAEAIDVAGRVDATSVRVGTTSALSLGGTYAVRVPDLDFGQASGRLEVKGSLIEVGGNQIDQVTSTLTYANQRVDVDATLTQGSRSLDVEAQARVGPLDEILVRRFTLATEGRRWELTTPGATIHYGPDRLGVTGFALAHGDETVSIAGALGADDDVLSVRVVNLDLAGVADWLPGAPALTGRVDADVTMTGPLADPVLTLKARTGEGSVNDAPYRALRADARYAGGQLELDADLDAGPVSAMRISGTMPVGDRDDGRYDLTIRSGDLDLGLFQPFVPQLSDLGGAGRFDARITGTVPDVSGTMTLADGRFRVVATGVTYEGVTADVTIAGRELTVRTLRLRDLSGRTAYVDGTVAIVTDAPYTLDLRVVADELTVLRNELGEVALSADVQVMGDVSTPLLAGTIEIERGRLEIDRILDRLNAAYAPVTADDPADEGPLTRASYSITLDVPDNVLVRGRGLRTRGGPIDLGDVNVTVGGALAIAKEVGEPAQVLGRLDVVRGQYQFQGRPFTIVRGSSARFQGDPFEPALDIEAERTISGVVASVHVAGSPSRPQISLSSDPPLDQGDVLSLIVFNQSMNRLPIDQRASLASRAGSLAVGAIATPIADSVARALDLDQFDIRAPESGTSGASVLVGRQVSDRLFVGFRHDFGAADVSEVSFEYRLSEFLRIVTSLAQGGSRSSGAQRAEAAGFDLIFVVR